MRDSNYINIIKFINLFLILWYYPQIKLSKCYSRHFNYWYNIDTLSLFFSILLYLSLVYIDIALSIFCVYFSFSVFDLFNCFFNHYLLLYFIFLLQVLPRQHLHNCIGIDRFRSKTKESKEKIEESIYLSKNCEKNNFGNINK